MTGAASPTGPITVPTQGRFHDDTSTRDSSHDTDGYEMKALSAEYPFLEEGDHHLHTVRSVRWQSPVPKSTRRWLYRTLGGLIASIVLVSLVVTLWGRRTIPRRRDALLDTTTNATLGFQKVFIINLKSQTDRKDRLELALDHSGIKAEFMEAITLDQANPKAIPWVADDKTKPSELGLKVFASWRSHLNAAQAIVDQNLGSALIFEDDVDWDVRIKDQLRDWALTSRQLIQPLKSDRSRYLDPTYFKANETKYDSRQDPNGPIVEWDYLHPAEDVLEPSDCAYGDLARWDVLWLGHCGQHFAPKDILDGYGGECLKTPFGKALRFDDETAPQTRYYDTWKSGNYYGENGVDHSRITHWSCGQVCNTAYALSNQGARKLLYDQGVRTFRGISDQALREICNGRDPYYKLRTCLSVTPPLFSQWLQDSRTGVTWTTNIQKSVQHNLERIVEGGPVLDQFPDGLGRKPTVQEEADDVAFLLAVEREAREERGMKAERARRFAEEKLKEKRARELEAYRKAKEQQNTN
ncbi:hypothetical protein AC579_1445 [Pseudocercospora musae]|uniref:Glycosyl transferase family 25 domain-containing protein n=1 Tax=Pseudocercospora musae TaxID=113226 RepID=A0A139IMI3_9PEZI|nr:hypothetical protein AC579_1445 [Pseudocercospora musae]